MRYFALHDWTVHLFGAYHGPIATFKQFPQPCKTPPRCPLASATAGTPASPASSSRSRPPTPPPPSLHCPSPGKKFRRNFSCVPLTFFINRFPLVVQARGAQVLRARKSDQPRFLGLTRPLGGHLFSEIDPSPDSSPIWAPCPRAPRARRLLRDR
jgi:hypothetical protein